MKEIEKLIAKYEAQRSLRKETLNYETKQSERVCLAQEICTLTSVLLDLRIALFNTIKDN